jgi:adenine-specific DNA-methyltransferase
MAAPALERRAQLAALIPEAFSVGQLDVSALKRAFGGDARIEPGQQETRGSEAGLT